MTPAEAEKKSIEVSDRAIDVADVGELGEGEVPVLGTLWHGAKALGHYGAALNDMVHGDTKGEEEQFEEGATESVYAIPLGAGSVMEHGMGDKGTINMLAKMMGGRTQAQIDEDEAKAKADEAASRERMDKMDAEEAAAKKRGPMGDVDALYLLQKQKYDAEMQRAVKARNAGKGGDLDLDARMPSLGDAITESRTTEGAVKALGYRAESTMANAFAPLAGMIGLGDISMETKANYDEDYTNNVAAYEQQHQHQT
jgi:hypothetical protein